MICPSYDPIASHCAPCCCVCSHNGGCITEMYNRLTPQNRELARQKVNELLAEQKNAALVLAHQNGKSRATTNDSISILRGGGRNCQA